MNLAVLEDDYLFLSEFVEQLQQVKDIKKIYKYFKRAEALEKIQHDKPELAFIDIKLPDGSGIDVIHYCKTIKLNTNFVVLTVFNDDKSLFEAIKAGAVGYLLKDEISVDKIEQVIKDVKEGGMPISSKMAKMIINEFMKQYEFNFVKLEKLTPREKDVLKCLSDGLSPKEIANELNISYYTVKEHQKRIYKKLQVNSYIQLIAMLKKCDFSS